MRKVVTREQWLNAGVEQLRAVFKQADYKVPAKVRVTCGWPSRSALARKSQRIGECWSSNNSVGKFFEIFISPTISDSVRALDILAHELVHATVGLKAKHGAQFKKCAQAIGLEGKMTATHAGAALTKTLTGIVKKIGKYPHKELKHSTNGEKKQTTRLVKVACPECGYIARVTRVWLDTVGAPLCPSDEVPLQE